MLKRCYGMAYKTTTAVKKIARLKNRIKIIQGGSSAGKTIAILLLLIDLAQSSKDKILISVVSESFPHLKRGAIRDFLSIMQEHGYYKENNWNRTDYIYTFETGNKIEFFSADQPTKVRGPRRDYLFINEANNIEHETYVQLAIRTNKEIYIDYNPTNSFWVHDEIIPTQEHDFIILTYKDNEALPDAIVKELESRKINKRFWQVYGLGLIGEVEGRIFTNWAIIDQVPHEAKLVRRGLDFGYSNDPSSLVAIYQYNGGYILDEELYRKGMQNKAIADYINNLTEPECLIIADSAEPKSIDELKLYGLTILPAEKGQGSVTQGIDNMQYQRISITKRSINGIKEYRNYMWMEDKDGKIINVPEAGADHFMDAARYAMQSLLKHTTSEAGIIDTTPLPDNYVKSYIVSEDGNKGFTYDVGRAIKDTEWR